jgi:20S proteasome alpha/beta subunit
VTTIVYRDGVMAADGLSSMGGYTVGNVVKIARGADGRLGGACGDAAFMGEFLKWVAGLVSEAPKAVRAEDGCDIGVLVHPGGKIEVFEPGGAFILDAPYFAMGSGRPVALGAMHQGATAAEAVAAAVTHDTGSGGQITVLTEYLATAQVLAA